MNIHLAEVDNLHPSVKLGEHYFGETHCPVNMSSMTNVKTERSILNLLKHGKQLFRRSAVRLASIHILDT